MFVHKKVYVSCDGIMYCANQREMCLPDPTRNRLIWRQIHLSCVCWQDDCEHLWDYAKVLRSANEDVQSWVDEALSLLRTKGGEELLDWLQPQMSGLHWKKRDSLNALLGYFRSRVGLTEYPTYRDNKWQIGSGMIESTAKQLVGIRLKGPGVYWSPAGASAITALRVHNINNNWHSLWKNLVT